MVIVMDKNKIDMLVNKYKTEMIENLSEFVNINTIFDQDSVDEKNPFGLGISKGLEFFYNLAKKDGFKVVNYDNYCVEVSYGEGEIFDILAHCDVVSISDTWNFPAFTKKYDDKYIYGRGTQDDKGPLLAAYYALKIIKEENIKSNKKIRFIVGGNEESGSKCLQYYYKTLKKEYPKLGFTPDAQFPLINGEKGITRLKVSCNFNNKQIKSIKGGNALNIVIDKVLVKIGNETKTYLGKAAHASKPELGKNAFINALEELKKEYIDLNKIYDDFKDYYGKGLNIDTIDEKLGNLTMNIGKVDLTDGILNVFLDIRYPFGITPKIMKENIEDKGYKCDILEEENPIYVDENSKLVKTLLDCYDLFLNTTSKPITIGGGTYAKSSKNVVAYGMLFEDDIDLMHQDNEKISIEHYILGCKIYLKAISELIK